MNELNAFTAPVKSRWLVKRGMFMFGGPTEMQVLEWTPSGSHVKLLFVNSHIGATTWIDPQMLESERLRDVEIVEGESNGNT